MKNSKNNFEFIVGLVVLVAASLFCLKLFSSSSVKNTSYSGISLFADFSNSEGVDIGSDVKIAGVKVGVVLDKHLMKNYKARIKIGLNKEILVPIDSSIAIVSSGLLGGKFVDIKVGIEDEMMSEGGVFQSSQSSLNLEELIGKFAFGGK